MILEEMKARRKELGLTYEELAERSGVPLSTVQKIFGGFTQSPNYRTVLALEEALNPEQSGLPTWQSRTVLIRSKILSGSRMACAANCGMAR